jgi:hypothetical protein
MKEFQVTPGNTCCRKHRKDFSSRREMWIVVPGKIAASRR